MSGLAIVFHLLDGYANLGACAKILIKESGDVGVIYFCLYFLAHLLESDGAFEDEGTDRGVKLLRPVVHVYRHFVTDHGAQLLLAPRPLPRKAFSGEGAVSSIRVADHHLAFFSSAISCSMRALHATSRSDSRVIIVVKPAAIFCSSV